MCNLNVFILINKITLIWLKCFPEIKLHLTLRHTVQGYIYLKKVDV